MLAAGVVSAASPVSGIAGVGSCRVLGGDAGEGALLKPCRNRGVGVADAALTKADKLWSYATLAVPLKRTWRQFENTRRFGLTVQFHYNVLLFLSPLAN
jgi:hypothetical protein